MNVLSAALLTLQFVTSGEGKVDARKQTYAGAEQPLESFCLLFFVYVV